MRVTLEPINSLMPYDNNPRRISPVAVQKVLDSIRTVGFKQPIVVDKNRVIVVGHTRWLAAKQLAMTYVPVVIADDLTDEQVKNYRIADNRTHQETKWNDDLLAQELRELRELGYDLKLTALEEDEIARLLGEATSSLPGGESYESKFEVVVTCADEIDQEAVYKLLTSKGYQCKVMSV
jgi:ParB/RepB/Spo0J family partition protein